MLQWEFQHIFTFRKKPQDHIHYTTNALFQHREKLSNVISKLLGERSQSLSEEDIFWGAFSPILLLDKNQKR